MKKTTILTIGDAVDFDSFRKLDKEKRFIHAQGFDYVAIDYTTLFKTSRLDIPAPQVLILTFFPFQFWDKHIECKNYKGLYGNLLFLKKFKKFSYEVISRIKRLLAGTQIQFINDPRMTASYRDKGIVMQKLSKAGVEVPPRIKAKKLKDIKRIISRGKKIYIKPRCGSMGKGITYVSEGNWLTNFNVRGGKIIQRCSDYGWRFKDVTGNGKFLGNILNGDFIMEEAVAPLMIGEKKIDFRVYACLGKVLFIYPRKNSVHAVTTNISQGGRGNPALIKKIPPQAVERIKKQVLKTMRALDLDLAGVDVILDEDMKNVYVIDVNMFPGFPKRRTHNLAREIIMQLREIR